MKEKDLIKYIEQYDSKKINETVSTLIKKMEDDIEHDYDIPEIKQMKSMLELITSALDNFDNLNSEKLGEAYNVDDIDNLKGKLVNDKSMIEDALLTIEKEKTRNIDAVTSNLKLAIENSEKRIALKRKSIKFFWINIVIFWLSLFTTSICYVIKSIPLSIVYTCFLLVVNLLFITTYIKIKVKLHKGTQNKFDYWQPIAYLCFSWFFEIIFLLFLFGVELTNKEVLFYISLVLNVQLITMSVGSFIKSFKLTDSDKGAFALSITLATLLFIFEKSFDAYMPLPNWVINGLLVISVLVWVFSIVKNSIISQKVKSKSRSNYFFLFVQIIFTISLGFYTLYRLFYHDINLFTNIATLYASLCGGGLTLGGVAWTIRSQEKIRQEEKRISTKPYINISSPSHECVTFFIGENDKEKLSLIDLNKISTWKKVKGKDLYCVSDIYIRNSKNSNILLDKIIINGHEVKIHTYNYIEKGEVLHIAGLFYFHLDYFEMKLSILDIDNKEYLFQIIFESKYYEEEVLFDDGSKKVIPLYRLEATGIREIGETCESLQ